MCHMIFRIQVGGYPVSPTPPVKMLRQLCANSPAPEVDRRTVAMKRGANVPARMSSSILPILAVVLAVAIFIFDTVTDLEIAGAVLYVAVVLISLRFCRRRGVMLVAAGCVALTLLSYFLTRTGSRQSLPIQLRAGYRSKCSNDMTQSSPSSRPRSARDVSGLVVRQGVPRDSPGELLRPSQDRRPALLSISHRRKHDVSGTETAKQPRPARVRPEAKPDCSQDHEQIRGRNVRHMIAQERAADLTRRGTEGLNQRCGCMPRFLRQVLTLFGTMAASPWAFTIVAVYAVLWLILDPGSFNWHGIATLATWCMTLFIQRSEHRDTQAIHAKLDELLKTHPNASNKLTRIDDEEPEEIESYRGRETRKTMRPVGPGL
jgi:low affinity Fe/Cu permease